MTANVLQPSLRSHVRPFGARFSFNSNRGRRLLILQSPPMAIGPEYTIKPNTLLSVSATLADSAQEWARIVLMPKVKSSATPSVLDLPPLELGNVLRPFSEDADMLGEMLDDTRF